MISADSLASLGSQLDSANPQNWQTLPNRKGMLFGPKVWDLMANNMSGLYVFISLSLTGEFPKGKTLALRLYVPAGLPPRIIITGSGH